MKNISATFPYTHEEIQQNYKRRISLLINSLRHDQVCRNIELEKKMLAATDIKDLYGLLLQYVYGPSVKCHFYQPSFTSFEIAAT